MKTNIWRKKKIQRKYLESLSSDCFNFVVINENKDWQRLKDVTNEFDVIADANGSYYFGLRSIENGSKAISFDPMKNDNPIRLLKFAKKNNVTTFIKFDSKNFSPIVRKDSEKMLIEFSKVILDAQEIHSNLGFHIINPTKNIDEILFVLTKIYNYPIIGDAIDNENACKYNVNNIK